MAERFSALDKFVFWWLSRQNVGLNPDRDRGAYALEQD